MTAVSQSYPNYLGGLNEQPDELKKPGQLVEALNVVPDPVYGLTRRPGFQMIASNMGIDPRGTWFEVELTNQVNDDSIYFGCIDRDGKVNIFNQDGVMQVVRYTDEPVQPHKSYEFNKNTNKLTVIDDNRDKLSEHDTDLSRLGYFKHDQDTPLKFCVSKDNIIFTNPVTVPRLAAAKIPGELANGTNHTSKENDTNYYSFINLKVVDIENYDYTFRRFYADDRIKSYTYITDIDLTKVDDIDADYDKDIFLPLQTEGPFRFTIGGQDPDIEEPAIVEVEFKGQVVQLKSDDGDGFRNEARYTRDVRLISAGKGFKRGQIYREKLDGVGEWDGTPNPDLTLTFKIADVRRVTATRNDHIVPNIPSGSTAEEILDILREEFSNVGIDKVVIVGTGLYLENSSEFSISTSELAVADIMNSQWERDDDAIPIVRVNTVGDLPVECYSGFIVQVSNSFDNEEDYYLEYVAESNSVQEGEDLDLTKSDGYWEEIAKPFEQYKPVSNTLPHMITIAKESGNTEFAFIVSPIDYEPRTAGTSKDNPSMFVDASPISDVNYYKNRLFFLTRIGTVITSRAAEINNLFLNTAISASVIDPVDVIANSNKRVPIHGSIVVNNAMVLFGDTEQYSVNTTNDIFSSDTVNVTKISNYTFDSTSHPTFLGTNLCFVSKGLTRMYEMTNIYDRGPVDVNERSQQIQGQFGRGFNMPVSSREQSMVVVYKRYRSHQNVDRSSDMYMYRYRQESSQETSQSAWVKWQVPHPVAYVSMPEDKMYVFVVEVTPNSTDNNKVHMYRMDSSTLSGLPADDSSIDNVPVFLDGYTYGPDGNVVGGEDYATRITFPTIYTRGQDSMDINANLTIHRIKLSTSAIGNYNLEIKRKGYDDYNLLIEQTPADEYSSNYPTLYGEKIDTIPIYTRNKYLTLTMSSTYNKPMTLRSMTWEGDYNRPFYKSG